jgi:hypothetical protein
LYSTSLTKEELVLERAVVLRERSIRCIAFARHCELLDVQCLERSQRLLARSRESLRQTKIRPLVDPEIARRRNPASPPREFERAR